MPRARSIPANHRLMLALPDAAAALDLSLNTLTALIEAGEIPLVRFATPDGTPMKRVRWTALEAWATAHEDRPAPVGKRRSA